MQHLPATHKKTPASRGRSAGVLSTPG